MVLNPAEIIKKATDLVTKLHDNEALPVPVLQVRAMRATENHPNDQTLRMLYNVLERMNEHGKGFITRAEFRELYRKFATSNNRASGYFEEELSLTELPKAKILAQAGDESVDIVQEAMSAAADPALVNAFSELWTQQGTPNKKAELKIYDPSRAKMAANLAELELIRLGAQPVKMSVFGGSQHFIICDATYNTPSGEGHVLVPVELTASRMLVPNMFLSKHGFVDLSKNAIITHLRESGGKNIRINANHLLDSLHNMQKFASMDEVELQIAVARANADKALGIVKSASENSNVPSLTGNPVYVEIDSEEQNDLDLPQSPHAASFASMLESPRGLAEYTFGRDLVEQGRTIVANKFKAFGYKPEIAVVGCDDDSISYAVKVSTANGPLGMQVLVDISEGKRMHLPNIVATNDKVYEFTREGVAEAVTHKISDWGMIAAVSPMYELKTSEVLDRLRKAADNHDFAAAEEALHVIAEKAAPDVYSAAVAEYMRSLSGEIEKKASAKCGCKKIIKSASHVAPICGHLNLPLDKVYQDEFGNCRPLYRRNMDETYEGLLFNTSKVLL